MSMNRHLRLPKPKMITTEVAKFGLIKVLRPFLRHPTVPFVAALIVPVADHMWTYCAAAEELLVEPAMFDEYGNEGVLVQAFDDLGNANVISVLKNLRTKRRSILLFNEREEVPKNVVLAADFIEDVEPPRAPHFAAAARRMGLGELQSTDAEFLASRPFEEIRLAATRGRPIASVIRRLRDFQPKPDTVETPSRPRGPQLEEMHGYGEAQTWGLQLARDLDDWRKGNIEWKDVDSGALLSGPPGCGKTSFAAALAQSCGVDLVHASAARWQAKGHLGDYLKAMHASFNEARRKRPCILFLDEFDSFGDREADDQNNDYKRQAINGLLEALDGAEGREGVVVIGATNNADVIDPALLRPGRIERHLRIPKPNAEARIAILRQHMGKAWAVIDLTEFAERTEGFTGADIALVAKTARRLARQRGTTVSASELTDAMPPRRLLSPEEMRRIAVHEAGHAVVGTLIGRDHLSFVLIAKSMGSGPNAQSLGHNEFVPPPTLLMTHDCFLDRIAMTLGGIAAEETCLGGFSTGAGGSAGSDLVVVTDIATMIEGVWGMGRALLSETAKDSAKLAALRARDPVLRGRVEATLRHELERATALIKDHLHVVERLAQELMTHGRVGGDAVRAMLEAGSVNTHPSRLDG